MTETTLGLSNTEMAQWRRCPRKWYLATYLGLKRRVGPEAGSALSIGDLVHNALAAYYDPAQNADPVAFAEAELEKEIKEHPADEDALRKEFGLVSAMLSGYLEWLSETGADSDLRILGSERMVRIPLKYGDGTPVGVHLLSKLDAPVEKISEGRRLALEHKTTGDLAQPLMGLRIDSQLLTEHLALFLAAKEAGASTEEALDACRGILYNMLKKVKRTAAAKPPFFKREEVTHNIIELRNHWHHVIAVAVEIQAATERLNAGESHHTVCRPNPMPHDCYRMCPFFRVCPMADDGSDFEGALATIYEEHDPLERYADAETL